MKVIGQIAGGLFLIGLVICNAHYKSSSDIVQWVPGLNFLVCPPERIVRQISPPKRYRRPPVSIRLVEPVKQVVPLKKSESVNTPEGS